MSSIEQENLDIAHWLSAIHLERYQESFKQHGYKKVRDILTLDNRDLQLIGIAATGHRKRIMSRLRDRSGKAWPQSNVSSLERAASQEIFFRYDRDDDRFQRNIGNEIKTSRDLTRKPVPKPRTVFSKTTTAIHKPHLISPYTISPATSSTYLENHTNAAGNIFQQEALVFRGSSLELEEYNSVKGQQPERVDLEVGTQKYSSTGAGKPFHPFPSLPVQQNKRASLPGSLDHRIFVQMEADTTPCSPLSAIPSFAGNEEEVTSFSTSPPSPQETLTMISNEIYSGFDQTAANVNWTPHIDTSRNNLSLKPSDLSKHEATSAPERLSCPGVSELELPVVPERPSSTIEINPYCEAVFNRSPQAQDPKDGKSTKFRTCTATMPMFTPWEEKGQARDNSDAVLDRKGEGEEGRNQIARNDQEGYATVDAPPANNRFSLPSDLYKDEILGDLTISPYASFTSLTERSRPVLSTWLDKLSPQGNYVFQRRYVKFDGQNLMYFSNDKELYPKGVIPLSSIEMARSTKENKLEVVTKHRTFVFRAENEAQRNEWCSTIQNRVKEHRMVFPHLRLGCSSSCQRSGYLELKGYKSKIFAVLTTDELWIHKNEQLFKMGIGMFVIGMHGSTIRDVRNKNFELVTMQKIFSFTAESEREKKEWMEALLESISESLSDYEVAEKIWSNKANKICADCRASNPDWASINLCVVICKQCAGVHRSLGTNISKVQSLKLDTSIWSNEIVQLFIILGNDRANRFWAARLLSSEMLRAEDPVERRREFIMQKYREGKYRASHPQLNTQDEILKVLCAAVAGPNLLKSVMQFFSDAEYIADPVGQDNAMLFVQTSETWRASTNTINTDSLGFDEADQARVYDEILQPVVHSGYLNKTAALTKLFTARKSKDEFHKHWCVLQKSLTFYDNDKSSEPLGKIEPSEVVCMGVTRLDVLSSPSPVERFRYMFEMYLSTEKVHQFGTDAAETHQTWTSAIGKWFTPVSCHCLVGHEFQRVGRMRYKAMLNPYHWMEGFFLLNKWHLFICPGDENAAEDSVNLRQLQELTVSPASENTEKKDMLILVEKGRTLYLQGVTKGDFLAWSTDIQAAACSSGNVLREQQLSRNDIPIIVDSCIAFLTQYGLRHEGIYRKNGAIPRIKLLIDKFRKDARNVKLRISDNFIEDVTDVLKRFFRELDDPIFTTELHPQWKEAADNPEKSKRLEKYLELINRLPRLNRATLTALIGHLYRVQKCADFNQMCTKNLALLFAPSLFQTDGKGEHEVKVMEDLIDNYACVFGIEEEQVTQMDLEISLITTWKDVQLSQAGDLIIEVYLELKIPDCCVTLKVSPVMTAEELTNQVLDMRNISASMDVWLTFEVFENGELERPLHPKEKVLEQALQWCKLAEPSSAFLLVKKIPIGEGSCLFTGMKRETPKCGLLKCREETPKLLGNKFQERYFVIRDHTLLLLKEKKSAKPEREWPLDTAKVYMGIRKKMKAPSQWGFTIYLDKQQLCLCCSGQPEMWDWITSILKAQHDNVRPVILRRHYPSDMTKQKFGTMPLVPIRGDDTNSTMVTANQTLQRLHTRRTLSMFFPMKMHQDSFEELQEKQIEEYEAVYEEVGNFQSLPRSESDFASEKQLAPIPLDSMKKPALNQDLKIFTNNCASDQRKSCSPERDSYRISHSLDRNVCVDSSLTFHGENVKSSGTERGVNPSLLKTVSHERTVETNRFQAVATRSQGTKSTLDLSSLPPLFFEPFPPSDTAKNSAWKKHPAVSKQMQDKLVQELNSIILKKNDPESTTGQQVT
ncbi:arf-GAP with Rho-GAP domain, ANK repeat and PH domain-containing protein 3-like isoform X2 [Xenopus laevis]|uniref:Arf-GAP with Rho-GAP domain, ANK repeat and PH domain-containing protein 3-like isoform X2 n=1 Tax=Xenopus laevis TaxID=8355 RepID=A0A8J1MTB2_XENLA|nr:arf-GAP with Rho-GAP domain, ANK repeat and PH domain-containing protein 3-like isoform X2 [Xenopus laevis]